MKRAFWDYESAALTVELQGHKFFETRSLSRSPRAFGTVEAGDAVLISRSLEYQLQLGFFSLNKSPTKVGTLNTDIKVRPNQADAFRLTYLRIRADNIRRLS